MLGMHRRWAALRAKGSQRGATVSLGMVIVLPVLLLATFGAITFAQWSHARNLAQGAAQRGVEQGRLSPASADRGAAEAGRFLTDHGAGGIHDVQITATLVDGVVQVRVTGTSSEAIPGLAPGVTASAAGPAEPNL
jgi:Tfp pilus assembly protein PilV